MSIVKPNSCKKVVIKFYDPKSRFDCTYCETILSEIKEHPCIQYIKSYPDYDGHIGYHYNCVLKSTSYKTLRALYTDKSDKKDPRVYMYMSDIKDTDMFCDWISYCSMREQTNFKRALPYGGTTPSHLREDEGDSNDNIRYTF